MSIIGDIRGGMPGLIGGTFAANQGYANDGALGFAAHPARQR
jgi:hypothetical protein